MADPLVTQLGGIRLADSGPIIPLVAFAGAIPPFAEYLWVDPTTTAPVAQRNGSIGLPFATIQAAIDDALARAVPVVRIELVGLGPFLENLVVTTPAAGPGIFIHLVAGPFPAVLVGAHTFTSQPMADVVIFSRDIVWVGTADVPAASTGSVALNFSASQQFFGNALPAPVITAAAASPLLVVLDHTSIFAGAGAAIVAATGELIMENFAELFGDTPTAVRSVDGLSDSEIGSRIAVTSLGVSESTPHRNMRWRETPGALVPTWDGPLGSFRADAFSLGTFLAALGALIPPATPVIGEAPRIRGTDLSDADLVLALDGGGATSAGFVNGGNWYTLQPATLTAAHSATLDPSGAKQGRELTITRLDTTANTYTIIDGFSAATLLVFPASKTGSAILRMGSAGAYEVVELPPT